MVWLPLLILPIAVAVFSWIEQTVLPQMWATGNMFGRSPTGGERLLQRAARWSAVGCAAMWWLFVLSVVVQFAT